VASSILLEGEVNCSVSVHLAVGLIFNILVMTKWVTATFGLNFINILRTAFTHLDPECAKRQSSQQCHLALLWPTSVKSGRKTLVKLTPDREHYSVFDIRHQDFGHVFLYWRTFLFTISLRYNTNKRLQQEFMFLLLIFT